MGISKKTLLSELNGKQCTATMIGGRAVEDWPDVLAALKNTYPVVNVQDDRVEFGTGNEVGTVNFILKPKFNRVRTGVFKVKSTKYEFEWGGKSSGSYVADLYVGTSGKIELLMFGGAILQYEPI